MDGEARLGDACRCSPCRRAAVEDELGVTISRKRRIRRFRQMRSFGRNVGNGPSLFDDRSDLLGSRAGDMIEDHFRMAYVSRVG